MNNLWYEIILGIVVSLLGIPAGYLVASFCKEELKPGKKYFLIMQKALLVIIALALLFYILSPGKDMLAVLLSIVFIFGLPTGALIALKRL